MSNASSQFKLWYGVQPRALRLLLSINVVVYLLWQLIFIHFEPTQYFVLKHLALNPTFPGVFFEPWQFLTYAFLHLEPGLGGLLHILFNMLWMFWIGKDYERLYGSGRILGLYVFGAVGGALLTVLLHALLPGVGAFGGVVHGASGAVLAIMTAVAIHHPEQRIGLMFIGVVRLIHVVIGFLALDILFLSSGGTSVSAHIGGVLAGLLCGKMILAGVDPTSWADGLFGERTRSRSGRAPSAHQPGDSMLHRMESWLASRGSAGKKEPSKEAKIYRMDVEGRAPAQTEESDVDRILDKISASGYDSLTKREKEILLRESGKKS
jgi:membrane associated rhomboid family serine protease